jgi:hypothetical protein
MINLICKREKKDGLELEIIKKTIELTNLILEIVFDINSLNIDNETIFDLSIFNFNKGPRLIINNKGMLSIIYNFTEDPSQLFGYILCDRLYINKVYSLKIFFLSNPYNIIVVLNNESKTYKLDVKYKIEYKNFSTNGICIGGGFNHKCKITQHIAKPHKTLQSLTKPRNIACKFTCGKLYMFNLYTNTNFYKYGILMSFDNIQRFYENIMLNDKSNENIMLNDEPNEIYKLILKNNRDKNISNVLMTEKEYTNRNIINDCRFYIENYNYIFSLNIILNKKCYINCFLSNEKCELFFSETINDTNYFDKCYNRVYYFKNCINNSYFMIFTAWEFNIPYFVYYNDTNILYNICVDETSINHINHISTLVNNYIKNTKINKINHLKLLNYYDSFYYGIGHISNAGHYFWQELFGLCFLIENNLINKLKHIVIGPYDYLGFKDLLKEKYENLNIINGNNFEYSNCIMTTLNCTYISNTYVEVFKKIYFEHNKPIIYELNNKIDVKVITFIIRNGLSRNVKNNFEIIYETIIYFIKKYNKLNFIFYITGWFFYNIDDNLNTNLENNNICDIQNLFINNIIDKIHITYPQSDIRNMIGVNINKILNLFSITDFLYDETGSSSMFATPIFNYKSIWSTSIPVYDDFLNQNTFLNIKNKIIPIPKIYINMMNDNKSYIINKIGYLDILNSIEHFNNV